MKLWDILKTVGSGIVRTAVPDPGGSLILGAVNAMLPTGKQLPDTATGTHVSNAISGLPVEKQAELLDREYNIKIEEIKQSHTSLQVMLKANAESKHTTRPKIAYQSFQIIAFSTVAPIAAWCYAVGSGNVEMLSTIKDSWMLILALTAPLVTVLHAYFGVLTQESKDRLNAAQGHKVNPVAGLVSKLFNRGK